MAGAWWDGPLPRTARCTIAHRVLCSHGGPPQAEAFCLSHLACGGRQPQVCGCGWRMALCPLQAEKIRPVTGRNRVRCATHSPSTVTSGLAAWPADDGRRRRRWRHDHTRIIVVILVAAANANTCLLSAIAKIEFALRFPLQPLPRTRGRRGRRAATAPPPQQQNTATDG